MKIKSILCDDCIKITKRKGVVKFEVVVDRVKNEFIITQEELKRFVK